LNHALLVALNQQSTSINSTHLTPLISCYQTGNVLSVYLRLTSKNKRVTGGRSSHEN
jgi:hypothetical protein